MANEKRLIDANELKAGLINLEASGGHKYYRKGMDDTLHFHMPNIIDDAPTVDAVEVVRCKDCEHWVQTDDVGYCDNPDGLDNYARPNDFCSYGKLKTETP